MNKEEYKKYKSFCFRQAKNIVGVQHPEFEDIVSDAMLAVLNALKLYDSNNESGASLNTYITKAIRNHILNYKIRYDNKKIAEESKLISRDNIIDEYSIDIVGFNENKDLHYDTDNTIKLINDYIITLKDERIKLIYKRLYQEDKTMTEVAEELNLNVESIRVNKVRLITNIRRHLEKINHILV